MTNELFLAQFRQLDRRDARDRLAAAGHRAPARWPPPCSCGSGRSSIFRRPRDADGAKLYHSTRQGVTFPLADALCWLLAVARQILDVLELEAKGPENPAVAEGLPGCSSFFTDLCHVQSARAAGEVGRICAELVFGYNRHPAWDDAGCDGCLSARMCGARSRHAGVRQRRRAM